MKAKFPVGLAAAGIAFAAGYTFFVRPWTRFWGATNEEVQRALPGDNIVPHPRYLMTHAITIQAPPAEIWPWLVQMGQGRGGLYSYDWLENAIGCDIHSTDQIIPEYQHLALGDTIRLTPPQRTDLALEVRHIEPERALVLCPPGDPAETMAAGYPYMSWVFVLAPMNAQQTRLLIRSRSNYKPTPTGILFNQVLLEPAHFMMERKMLLEIKQRVEQHKKPASLETPQNIPVVIV